jgi:hypothetical protein
MKQEHKDLLFKAVCSYLPYGLKLYFEYTNKVGEITNIYNIDEDVKLSMDYRDEEHIWMFKPILRPLSQLTEEIEHNGEMFEPLERLKCPELGHVDYISNEREYWIKKHEHQNWLDPIPYGLIQLLLKWHFDIYGLIELGLAIEKN